MNTHYQLKNNKHLIAIMKNYLSLNCAFICIKTNAIIATTELNNIGSPYSLID